MYGTGGIKSTDAKEKDCPQMWLLIAFIAVPLIEIGLFIQVGGWLGLWPTLAIVLLTAVLGTAMVRSQGLAVLGQLQAGMDGQGDPAEAMVHGAMILFSGALLLTPGFFTDAVGFALLVPGIRIAIFAWARRNMALQTVQMGGGFSAHRGGPGRGETIETAYEEIDPEDLPPKPGPRPSGWTRD